MKGKMGFKSVIGTEYVKLILEYIRHGDMNEYRMEEIAEQMNVRGVFKKKSAEKNIDPEDVMCTMLRKWFSQYLYKLKDGEGYEILIQILEHEDVQIWLMQWSLSKLEIL